MTRCILILLYKILLNYKGEPLIYGGISFATWLLTDNPQLSYIVSRRLAQWIFDHNFSKNLLLSMNNLSLEEKVLKRGEKFLLNPAYQAEIFHNLQNINDDALSRLVSKFIDFSEVTHIPSLQNIIREFYSYEEEEDHDDTDQEEDD